MSSMVSLNSSVLTQYTASHCGAAFKSFEFLSFFCVKKHKCDTVYWRDTGKLKHRFVYNITSTSSNPHRVRISHYSNYNTTEDVTALLSLSFISTGECYAHASTSDDTIRSS